MALSYLLRSSVNLCRVSGVQGVSLVTSARPLSILAKLRLDSSTNQQTNAVTSLKIKPLGLIGKVQGFTTSSVVRASGIPDHHDHSKIWTWERMLSVGLLPLVPLSIMYPNVLFDLLVSVSVVMHIHWGVEAVVVDYIRPIIFGKVIAKLSLALVYAFSVVLLISLLNLSFRGPGIGNSVNTLWSM